MDFPFETNSRRLTGANLHWDLPCAIIDVEHTGRRESLLEAWQVRARQLLKELGFERQQLTHRFYDGGMSLLISAPVDVLYSMCELNEVALSLALADLDMGGKPDLPGEIRRLKAAFDEERNPALLALQVEAARHGIPFLWDDDAVSVGYGKTALTWKPRELPGPADLDWEALDTIPVAMVTGTNGKSTTVRMAAAMIAEAGLNAGLTSTDWIRVGDTILDTGDYSGTGGARTLMRHPDTEVAVLETARGGLLRRGLGVERTAAALITNVAADHLGDWGINTVAELIEAKFIVRRALSAGAPLILNADDTGVVDYAQRVTQPIRWFSLDAHSSLIRKARQDGDRCAYLSDDGKLILAHGRETVLSIAISSIPATMNGAAKYNISNALGAVLLCDALGIAAAAMRAGLCRFRGDEQDNPGRGNWFEARGVRILVDFAHNEHGMQALAETVASVPSARRVLLMGQAGDRPDRDIRHMALAACSMGPDEVLTCALPGYERGRPQAEVQRVIRLAALESGIGADHVRDFDSPSEAAARALEEAREGDLLVLLALTQRDEVLRLIHGFMAGDPSRPC